MTKENVLLRILYTGAGIIILEAALLTVVILPCVIINKSTETTTGNSAVWILVMVILHLLILYAFREAIIVNGRNGHLENIVFIASGTLLLLFGLMLTNGALRFSRQMKMHLASISMFICVGCDFFAAVIAFTALFLQPRKRIIGKNNF